MKEPILSLIWVMAAMAVLNAQQVSPNQTTTTQRASKPKAAATQPFPQPRVQPTQATTAKNNPDRGKRVANGPSHPKPAVNNGGMANQSLRILGMVTRLLPTVATEKIPRTIATVMPMLCAATGMNGMTAIGGNNTMS